MRSRRISIRRSIIKVEGEETDFNMFSQIFKALGLEELFGGSSSNKVQWNEWIGSCGSRKKFTIISLEASYLSTPKL